MVIPRVLRDAGLEVSARDRARVVRRVDRRAPDAFDGVPEDVREQMSFHPVMSIDEVLDVALEPAPLEAVA